MCITTKGYLETLGIKDKKQLKLDTYLTMFNVIKITKFVPSIIQLLNKNCIKSLKEN